jgi:DNA-binding protein
VKKIDINTEELTSPESGELNLVSSMEIHLSM